jgi:hypothetical protein
LHCLYLILTLLALWFQQFQVDAAGKLIAQLAKDGYDIDVLCEAGENKVHVKAKKPTPGGVKKASGGMLFGDLIKQTYPTMISC